MSKLNVCSALLLLLAQTNCKSPVDDGTHTPVFYPLNVGNNWQYEITYFDTLGVPSDGGSFDETIVSDTLVNGLFLYELKSPFYRSPLSLDLKFYYLESSDGLYLTYSYGNSLEPLYKFPCAKGDYFISNAQGDTTFVLSLEDTVVTNIGLFVCIKYEQRGLLTSTSDQPTYRADTYVAPRVGKIKEELFVTENNQSPMKKAEHILTNYTLN